MRAYRFMRVLFLQINKNIELVYLSFGLHQQDDGLFGSGKICDPFSAANYTYVPEKCSKNDIQIGELPNVSKRFHEPIIYDTKGKLTIGRKFNCRFFRDSPATARILLKIAEDKENLSPRMLMTKLGLTVNRCRAC